MKKLLVASAALIALAFAACNNKAEGNAPQIVPEGEAYETAINIRYVQMDSIFKYYTLAIEINQEAQEIAMNLQQYQNTLTSQLQSEANRIQQKLQSQGYLSQASYEDDMKKFNDRQVSYQNQLAKREQEANARMNERQKILADSIHNFIEVFNQDRKYDAILTREAGLYFNPALDITADVIEGLNKAYKPAAVAAVK